MENSKFSFAFFSWSSTDGDDFPILIPDKLPNSGLATNFSRHESTDS